MTTKEMKEALKEEVVAKYERFKYRAATAYHRGEISADDFKMRKKFITREANMRLNEIDQMSPYKVKKMYEKKHSPEQ